MRTPAHMDDLHHPLQCTAAYAGVLSRRTGVPRTLTALLLIKFTEARSANPPEGTKPLVTVFTFALIPFLIPNWPHGVHTIVTSNFRCHFVWGKHSNTKPVPLFPPSLLAVRLSQTLPAHKRTEASSTLPVTAVICPPFTRVTCSV